MRKAPAMLVHRPSSVGTDRLVAFPDHLVSVFRTMGSLTTVCEMVGKSDQAVGSDEQRSGGPVGEDMQRLISCRAP